MTVIFFCFTDDPFDLPGENGHGGSHIFVFDLGLYLISQGINVIYITRLNNKNKPLSEKFGEFSQIFRLPVGLPIDIDYYKCGEFINEFVEKSELILKENFLNKSFNIFSYNWISGEVGRMLSDKFKLKHTHFVLALGRSRLANGESSNKINKFWLEIELEVFKKSDCIVTFSLNEALEIEKYYGKEIDKNKIVVIPYAIDTQLFTRRPIYASSAFHWASTRFKKGISNIS